MTLPEEYVESATIGDVCTAIYRRRMHTISVNFLDKVVHYRYAKKREISMTQVSAADKQQIYNLPPTIKGAVTQQVTEGVLFVKQPKFLFSFYLTRSTTACALLIPCASARYTIWIQQCVFSQ